MGGLLRSAQNYLRKNWLPPTPRRWERRPLWETGRDENRTLISVIVTVVAWRDTSVTPDVAGDTMELQDRETLG